MLIIPYSFLYAYFGFITTLHSTHYILARILSICHIILLLVDLLYIEQPFNLGSSGIVCRYPSTIVFTEIIFPLKLRISIGRELNLLNSSEAAYQKLSLFNLLTAFDFSHSFGTLMNLPLLGFTYQVIPGLGTTPAIFLNI